MPQLILEYYPLGNWTDAKIQEDECVTALGQVLDGLRHLHQTGIAHRDLKPDNILVEREPYLRFAISDFGLSKLTTDTALLTTFCGTLKYAAPEVFPGVAESYEVSVDIWSLGVLVLEAVYGIPKPPEISKSSHPWKEWTRSWFQRLRHILDDQEDDDILVAILTDMISFNPGDRPDANDCLCWGFEAGLFERRADDELVISRDPSNPEQTTQWTTSSRFTSSPGASTSPQSEASTVVNGDVHFQEHLLGNENASQPDGHRRILLPEDHTTQPASQGFRAPWEQEISQEEQENQQLMHQLSSRTVINKALWDEEGLYQDNSAGSGQEGHQSVSQGRCQPMDAMGGSTTRDLQQRLGNDSEESQALGADKSPASPHPTDIQLREISAPHREIANRDRRSWPVLTVACSPSEGTINLNHLLQTIGKGQGTWKVMSLAAYRAMWKRVVISKGPQDFQGTYVTLDDARKICSRFSIDAEILSWLDKEMKVPERIPRNAG